MPRCHRVRRRLSSPQCPALPPPPSADTGGSQGKAGKAHTGSSPAGRALPEALKLCLLFFAQCPEQCYVTNLATKQARRPADPAYQL